MPNVRHITWNNETKSLKDWAASQKIPAETISSRIDRGWSLDRALTELPDRRFTRGGRFPAEAVRPCPPMKRHPQKGTAWCRWQEHGSDRSKFFGPWGSDEAKRQYQKFVMEWQAGVTQSGGGRNGDLLVNELCELWLDHCGRTYTKRGKPTSEVHCNKSAVKPLLEMYRHDSADELTGRKLKAVRERMVDMGWVRDTVNAHIGRIVRMYKWAATEGHVPKDAHDSLALVEQIPAGRRDDLDEGDGVPPAPLGDIQAVLNGEHLHPKPERRAVLSAMVRVQLLTGMRPGEACGLKAEQIDRSLADWRYEVVEYNKMLHRNIKRPVFFGPEAQGILTPILAERNSGFVFRLPPARAGAKETPITPRIYRDFVKAACRRAGVPEWTPNQLRHTRATELMDRYESDEAVAAVLGNSPEVTRQVYADRAGETVARRIARATG